MHQPFLSDEELVRRFAVERDEEAYEELYRRYYKRSYNTCLDIAKNPATAEDLAQEVWLSFYRHSEQFRGDAKFSSWIYRVAVNQSLMRFRKRYVKNEAHGLDDEPRAVANFCFTPAFDSKILCDQVLSKMAVTGAGMAAVLELHDIEGLEHVEIGRRLGVTNGTSKSQLHKARERAKKILGEG